MFFQKLKTIAWQNKRVLGAASVAGFGLGAASTESNHPVVRSVRTAHSSLFSSLLIWPGGLGSSARSSGVASCSELDWPIYRREQVQKEARENGKVWVTHGSGVYDLTEFAKSHPGGSAKLLMANGGPIEPFWEMYPFHKEEQVISLLKAYKVGELDPKDVL